MGMDLFLGLITGILFGFFMQKARVLHFEKQVGALLLKDMTIFKFMLSAILVGMVGLHILAGIGFITFSHKAMNVGAVLLGGALFGGGWAVMGFCPGTSVGALGEGRWHAIFAILGMVTGAAVYAEFYPFFNATVLQWVNLGNLGLPEILGLSTWLIIPLFVVCTFALFYLFEKKGL